jgi:hypothetical protein
LDVAENKELVGITQDENKLKNRAEGLGKHLIGIRRFILSRDINNLD